MGSGASLVANRKDVLQLLAPVVVECLEMITDLVQIDGRLADVQDGEGLKQIYDSDSTRISPILSVLAKRRMLRTWQNDWSDDYDSPTFNSVEHSDIQTAVVESGNIEDSHLLVPGDPCQQIAFIAESQDLASLGWLSGCTTKEHAKLVALNLQSNQLTEENLCESVLPNLQHLFQLSLGGNALSNMSGIVASLPANLLFLDLSYTEGLMFSPGVFIACPQLLHLCIDGCALASTSFADDCAGDYDCVPGDPQPHQRQQGRESTSSLTAACRASMFFGLICLTTLSMKENVIESVHGFSGLAYFAMQSSSHKASTDMATADGRASEQDKLPDCLLRHLFVAENPVFEASAELKIFTAWVSTTLPTVRTIDGKPPPRAADTFTTSTASSSSSSPSVVAVVDHSSMAYRVARQQQATLMGVTDTMEREFTAALRGEKDVAVVS